MPTMHTPVAIDTGMDFHTETWGMPPPTPAPAVAENRQLQERLQQLEIENAQLKASKESEKRNFLRQIANYRSVLERYCIPLDDLNLGLDTGGGCGDSGHGFQGFEPSPPSKWAAGNSAFSMFGMRNNNLGSVGPLGGHNGNSGTMGISGSILGNRAGGGMPLATSTMGVAASTSLSILQNRGLQYMSAARGEIPLFGNQDHEPKPSSLDTKIQKLNNLLQESGSRSNRSDSDPQMGLPGNNGNSNNTNGNNGSAQGHGFAGNSGKAGEHGGVTTPRSIASTLRSMFPHAKVRTSQHEDDPEVSVMQRLRRLERDTGEVVDDRTVRALQALTEKEGREALAACKEMLQGQGGQSRNLSAFLLSCCRKAEMHDLPVPRVPAATPISLAARLLPTGRERALEERLSESGNSAEVAAALASSGILGPADPKAVFGPSGAGSFNNRTLNTSTANNSNNNSNNNNNNGTNNNSGAGADQTFARTTSVGSEASKLNTPAGQRSNRSWADIHSDDEDEADEEDKRLAAKSADKDKEKVEAQVWTPRHVESAARKGFDLRRRGDDWQLRVTMSGVEPTLTEGAMQMYCRWLRVRLTAFQAEHGANALRHCSGEIDFSHNSMSDNMLWLLLDTLTKFEVQASILKLFGNQISHSGALAICEFLRQNEQAGPVTELHLSHNSLTDESALEIMRTMQKLRPRYPPQSTPEGGSEPVAAPVWLRLSHNHISSPENIKRVADEEGITYCLALDRELCSIAKCKQPQAPIVHLCGLDSQILR